MDVLLKKIWLELIHLSLAFSIGSWTCGHTLPLLVAQATTIASFIIIILLIFFCTYFYMHFHMFNFLSY